MRATLASGFFIFAGTLVAQSSTPAPQLTPDQIKAIQGVLSAGPQVVPPSVAPATLIPAPALPPPTMLPKVVITGGGGFASPSGSFAYISESSLVLPQNTYATVSQEYTLIHKQVQSCTFAGITKPLYQFSVFTIGLTGLGGGCTSSSGENSGAGSGQGFLHIRWGKLAFGNVITATKNTMGGYKVTLGFAWSQLK